MWRAIQSLPLIATDIDKTRVVETPLDLAQKFIAWYKIITIMATKIIY